ncbi:hypothetical protein COO91_00681 [Nostoc flagelliforme CCNUN1]|uniref:Uncharacterized protein n=1 Tax=Nostoc flagelliforme CCNUN1 TaxID=2038116 RepID=A0A2K8SHU4_9NOSO|nr:hypothetical protein COO91_00681 [Nostoc flagelliforme CCNUN1]
MWKSEHPYIQQNSGADYLKIAALQRKRDDLATSKILPLLPLPPLPQELAPIHPTVLQRQDCYRLLSKTIIVSSLLTIQSSSKNRTPCTCLEKLNKPQ